MGRAPISPNLDWNPEPQRRGTNERRPAGLFEVVNHDPGAVRLEGLLDKFEVRWVDLVFLFLLLALELDIQGHLIALIHDVPMALHHASHMEVLREGDRTEVFLRSRDQFIGGVGNFGLGPENDDVGKHGDGDL